MGLYPRLFLFAFAWLAAAQPAVTNADRLAAIRNLGKAFYENPTTHKEAVVEFAKAVAMNPRDPKDRLNYGLALLRSGATKEGMAELERVQREKPDIPHTWFNLGIQWKKFGETDKALAQIRKFVVLAPNDPPGHYNLGVLLKQNGDITGAIAAFRKTTELDPRLFGPHFQLFNLFRQSGKTEDAKKELEIFQRLKKEKEGEAVPEDLEWSWFSEIFDEVEPAASPSKVAATFRDAPVAGLVIDPTTARMQVLANGLLLASKSGVIVLNRDGSTRWKASGFAAAAGDANNDGVEDFAVLSIRGVELHQNGAARLLDKSSYTSTFWLDYDHDNDLDLVLLGAQSRLLRNEGDRGFNLQPWPFAQRAAQYAYALREEPDSKATDVAIHYADGTTILHRDQLGGKFTSPKAEARTLAPPRDLANKGLYAIHGDYSDAADFNGDGRLEELRNAVADDIDRDGRVDQWVINGNSLIRRLNTTTPRGNWITVQLEGVKNPKLAYAAEVEVKAGRIYQKRFYTGAPLTFSLGAAKEADTVRITWPNGLIQGEVHQAANKAYVYKEAQRLSGSCPHIWTWNGREFEYISDVLGVAPLGASSGDGQYFPVDHDEHIQIPASALREKDGLFEIRITEELSEVAYLDQVKLLAVDHPIGESLYVSDKFKAPPFPDFKLYAARTKWNAKRDGNVFDFGVAPPKRSMLVLHGWVDWADGSTFLQSAQTRDQQLRFPKLEAQKPDGSWITIVEDMGIPAGKPKSIVAELGELPSTRLRIDTNLDVHWNDVFLTPDVSEPQTTIHAAKLSSASLRFRGFSAVTIHPQRKEPERFHYGRVEATSMWNPTPGLYTRYGEVKPLLNDIDDNLTIMGSGDELRLLFDANLPPVKPGFQREYILKVDGWAKDRDPNTAFSNTVDPLPHHGMSQYPYSASEPHPGGDWIKQYNTRPALRLLRPLITQR
ncbi:MAG: tetratricopeptide repeat protein [Acidobacteria bacterium]|nr:tetratricopeptide repeat protein [Acidobacteriota bacterium]